MTEALMEEGKTNEESTPIVLHSERRARRVEELSSAEVMKIVRKRAAGKAKMKIIDVDDNQAVPK